MRSDAAEAVSGRLAGGKDDVEEGTARGAGLGEDGVEGSAGLGRAGVVDGGGPGGFPGAGGFGGVGVVEDDFGVEFFCDFTHFFRALAAGAAGFLIFPGALAEHVEIVAAKDEDPAAGEVEAVGVEIGNVPEGVFLSLHRIGFAGPAEDAAGAEVDEGDEFGVRAGGVCGVQVDAEGEIAGLAAGGAEEAGREDAGGDRFSRLADGGEVLRVGLPAGGFGCAGRQRSFSEAARGDEEADDEVPGPVLERFQEELFPAASGFADEHEAGDGGRAGTGGGSRQPRPGGTREVALRARFDGETELAEAGVGFGAAGVLVGFQRPAGGVLDGEGEDVFGRVMLAVVDQAEAGGAAVFWGTPWRSISLRAFWTLDLVILGIGKGQMCL